MTEFIVAGDKSRKRVEISVVDAGTQIRVMADGHCIFYLRKCTGDWCRNNDVPIELGFRMENDRVTVTDMGY